MRAQTTMDFTIGIVIFLGVVVFAFSFVPGILQPFELSDDENPSKSDRIANHLSQDMLGSTEQPHDLDRYCTVAFFNETYDASDSCNYNGGSLSDVFNLDGTTSVNITLKGNISGTGSANDQLCWGDGELVDTSDSACGSDDVLARGDEVTDGEGTTITARRVVFLNGRSVTLEVVLW
jgi:hypothetical protein